MGDEGEAHVHAHTDGDTETLPCVKVALPITASVSFRAASAAQTNVDEEWRSLATETAPRPQEVLQLAAMAVTASQPSLVVDDSPTDVMTRPWWRVQVVRPGLWEPPVPIVPQLPLELLPRAPVEHTDVRPAARAERTDVRPAARRTTDSRTIVAPLSLLLVALSVVPPVVNAPASPVHVRTASATLHEADTTPPVVCPPAPVAAPLAPEAAPVAPVVARAASVVAPIKVAVQRRPPAQAPRHAAPHSSGHLVREVPF
jgi:hypothetical protein